jgi:hypothetical protein
MQAETIGMMSPDSHEIIQVILHRKAPVRSLAHVAATLGVLVGMRTSYQPSVQITNES